MQLDQEVVVAIIRFQWRTIKWESDYEIPTHLTPQFIRFKKFLREMIQIQMSIRKRFVYQVEHVQEKNLVVCATGSSGEGKSRLLLSNLAET